MMKDSGQDKQRWWFLDVAKVVMWPSLALLFRIKKYRVDPEYAGPLKGPAIIVCNHASVLEPLALITAFISRRISFLAFKQLFEFNPVFSWLMRQFGCVPVDREQFEMGCIFTLAGRIKVGGVAALFPEGKLSRSGELLPFKSGAVLLALQTGAPIVPVYLNSGQKLWHRRRLVIGAPIDASALAGSTPSVKTVNMLTELLEERVRELSHYLEKHQR